MIDKLKAFWATLVTDAKDLWNKDKFLFLGLLALLLAAKFRDILTSLIVGAAKSTTQNAEQKNEKLVIQENVANNEANDLVKDAKTEETKPKPEVDENWNKS